VDMLRLVPRRLHKAFQKFDVKRGSLSDTSTLGSPKCLKMLSKIVLHNQLRQ